MTTQVEIPHRFRSAEARGIRLGRPLKVIGRVDSVDEALMTQIGEAFTTCDEVGARLAEAFRSRGPGRVTMAQFERALADGIPDQAPPALRAFFEHVEDTPAWVNRDLVEEGARVFRQFGRNASDVLLQLALIGGYRFGGPTDLLVATGGLTGDTTKRRLGETQRWAIAISTPGALERSGEGWRLTVHVRLMHALVNHRFRESGRWDADQWGLPINDADQAATLGLFDGALLLGVRALGVRVTREESRAVMHLWKYVGWLVGVDDSWLVDDERSRHRLNYHLLLAQADVTEAGQQLANSIVDAQRTLTFDRWAAFQRWYAPRRLLSMLRPFLGRQGLQDLALPVRGPWATAAIVPRNLVLSHLLGRTSVGESLLQRLAARNRDRLMRQYFGTDEPRLADLPTDAVPRRAAS